ncbi:hypothetical protein AB3S75_043166 [Citrus x aurantiifolia]
MDSNMKHMKMDDLERFVKRKEFYRNVGKAWKRGYLLYSPPRTGKSSLTAAMANYLNFDVCDLELTTLRDNVELRNVLIATKNKSIPAVEDSDCSINLQGKHSQAKSLNPVNSNAIKPVTNVNQEPKVTLSGLLNFIDGVCRAVEMRGSQYSQLIIKTDLTLHLLLRPGCMDMHIHMSYCTPCGLKMLASNYFCNAKFHHFKLWKFGFY